MILTYLPDGTNIYGARGVEFDGIGSVYVDESCEIVLLGGTSYSLLLFIHLCCKTYG